MTYSTIKRAADLVALGCPASEADHAFSRLTSGYRATWKCENGSRLVRVVDYDRTVGLPMLLNNIPWQISIS